jgi:hypothetical protein
MLSTRSTNGVRTPMVMSPDRSRSCNRTSII